MQNRSLQSSAEKPVALGLMVALAFSSTGCEALGIGKGKPPPPAEVRSASSNFVPRPQVTPRRLEAFGLAGPQNEALQPAQAPVAAVTPVGVPAGPATLNGNPNGLNRDVLNSAIQGTMASLATCFSPSAENPAVSVSFEADPAGRASLVRVHGALPEAERCVRNVVQGMRFPRFEGNGVHVDLPLTFHQVGRAQQAAAPSGESQGPSGPPLNIEP
jgi:hypothetical protein